MNKNEDMMETKKSTRNSISLSDSYSMSLDTEKVTSGTAMMNGSQK